MKHVIKKSKYVPLVLLLFLFACQSDPDDQQATDYSQTGQEITIEQKTFAKESSYCQQDSTHCMRINASYPYLVTGPSAVIQAINDTIAYHLKSNLAVFAVDQSELDGSLDSIADAYILDFEQLMQETPDYPFAWEIEVEGSILHKSAKVLSVALNAYSYTGGAHPNIFLDLINFDLTNGKKLNLRDIFTDEDKLRAVVEKKFREVREIEPSISIADAGFFWGDSFSLPQNFALQEEGVYFHYNPYEAAAYALGSTEFTIPYEDLKEVIRQP
ncbi:DUF3298 and DUF4163 domain-containing protein [Flavilitoribacter nigricans]|uniref:DUF3298 domain-containing protein n=1 Tax=Flavilitoribacter nigricans (strain ATCC 23147 / DSM 23189 / NBRC 102662 / NCIMB 1420 / SS-2) TaxID=1122177 RepID=A0A2D0N2J6_FLAN2|nr:DUF3298 and DUF4163 domain-containing protein [Flavilitoribacter nigricans]PHN02677.1 hypothetical protein CRP01_31280 [Flavilitoribacter nigricans DSM 23189 = NBRC 102662]